MVSERIKLLIHLFHAMIQFVHCESGLVEATFDFNYVYAWVIIDGTDCGYAAARLAIKSRKTNFS
jgi:N-acetylglucosamine-6-phosphate deacetylase